jgi:hypothetical protein
LQLLAKFLDDGIHLLHLLRGLRHPDIARIDLGARSGDVFGRGRLRWRLRRQGGLFIPYCDAAKDEAKEHGAKRPQHQVLLRLRRHRFESLGQRR